MRAAQATGILSDGLGRLYPPVAVAVGATTGEYAVATLVGPAQVYGPMGIDGAFCPARTGWRDHFAVGCRA